MRRLLTITFFIMFSFSCHENLKRKQNTVFDLCKNQTRTEIFRNISNLRADNGYKGLKLGIHLDSLDLSNFIVQKITDSLTKCAYYFGPSIKVADNLTKDISLIFYNKKLSSIEFNISEDFYNTDELYIMKYGTPEKKIENFIDENKRYHKSKFLLVPDSKQVFQKDKGRGHEEIINLTWKTDKIELSIKKNMCYFITKYDHMFFEEISYHPDSVWITKAKDDSKPQSIIINYSLIEYEGKINQENLKIFNKNRQIEKNRKNRENLERINDI